MGRDRCKAWILAAAVVTVTLIHRVVPASHAWHGWHLIAERLYYAPILMGSAWLGYAGSAAITLLASVTYLLHVAVDWGGQPMVQAEQTANLATFWLVGLLGSVLFRRWKRAMAEAASAHEETLAALAGSLELREPYTSGHSERVRTYTLLLARQLGIRGEDELRLISNGAMFHDIGKIGVPDAILLKPDALTSEEEGLLRKHPEMGAKLIGRVAFLRQSRDLVLSHHERYDGTGYPRGIRSTEIPLGARIFAVADAFDAMTTDRPYRTALSFEEALTRIQEGRGRQFDPAVVDAFLAVGFERWNAVAEASGSTLRRTSATDISSSEHTRC